MKEEPVARIRIAVAQALDGPHAGLWFIDIQLPGTEGALIGPWPTRELAVAEVPEISSLIKTTLKEQGLRTGPLKSLLGGAFEGASS